MNTDIAIYIVFIYKSKPQDPKFKADIIDENGDSVFEKKKILGSNEEQALRRLALALKVEIMLREADIRGQRLGGETDMTYKLRIQRHGTERPRAVITMTKICESDIKACGFLLDWMNESLKAYDDEYIKKEESEEDVYVYVDDEENEEESGEEFEGEKSHVKANQGKKRDKVSSGQHP